MKIAVTGGRTYMNKPELFEILDTIHKEYGIKRLIHGGAKGTDTLAEMWAKDNNIPTDIFLPDWDKYGKAAGPIRNKLILDEKPDMVIVFPDGSFGS